MIESATTSSMSNRRRAVLFGVLTVGIGPPVGWTLLYIAFVTASILKDPDGSAGADLQPLLGLWAIGALYSYVVGGLAAVPSALVVALRVLRHGTVSYLYCAATAAIITAICSLAWGVRAVGTGYSDWNAWLIVAACGAVISAVAALICRWLAGRMGVLPPDTPPSPVSPQS